MKKLLNFIKGKIVLLGAVIVSAIVGGASTAIVLAAIPDGDGIIHACRLNLTGAVRIIDSASQNCSGLETAINWSQGGGGGTIHDADGQVIGNILDSRDGSGSPLVVYNSALNRIVSVNYSDDAAHYAIVNAGNSVYFASDDCTGTAYTFDDHHSGVKTELIRTGDSSYGIVQDNATAQSITIGSINQYDLTSDSFSCNDISDTTDSFYAISSVSLPFDLPLASPFKF